MADQPRSTGTRRCLALASAVCWFLASAPAVHAGNAPASVDAETTGGAYQFVCDDGGRGSSVVDVLRATGEHETFLDLFSRYDPEGFEILSDPVLADKTVWAPTDGAFDALGDAVSALSDAEIKAVLGNHITPPRRTPEGPYPVITPEYLLDGGEVVHQTRTGILTGSDQRVRTRANDGVLTVEDSTIAPTSWCTQTGSVFSIDAVITDASAASLAERVIYTLFFKSPILTLTGLGALVAGVVVLLRRRRAQADPELHPLDGLRLFGPDGAADVYDDLHPNPSGYRGSANASASWPSHRAVHLPATWPDDSGPSSRRVDRRIEVGHTREADVAKVDHGHRATPPDSAPRWAAVVVAARHHQFDSDEKPARANDATIRIAVQRTARLRRMGSTERSSSNSPTSMPRSSG